MKLALIGNGAMGRLVAARAREDGHQIDAIISSNEAALGVEELSERLRRHDAAIDFSVTGAALRNIEACARAGVPLVEGTTGWHAHEQEARRIVEEAGGALIYGANFSVGVNLFYRIVARAAELFVNFDTYAPFIEEAHHARKRDAPSGTAHHLRDIIVSRIESEVPVTSTRAGHIPGTHRVTFDSLEDQITLTHMARSRDGFAAGALVAARWIQGRRGVYEFAETIDEILKDGDK